MNIISTTMLFVSSTADSFRTVFAITNVAVMNVMACRVYRNTILFAAQREPELITIQI